MESRHKQPNQTILKVFSFFKEFFCSTYPTTTIPGNRKKYCVKTYFPVRQKMVSSSYKEEKTIVNAGMDRK